MLIFLIKFCPKLSSPFIILLFLSVSSVGCIYKGNIQITVISGNSSNKTSERNSTDFFNLADLNPAPVSINYLAFTDNRILYTGTDLENGTELWISDGTPSGTKIVKDIFPGILSSAPQKFFLDPLKNVIYFMANDSIHGSELWVSDGTSDGTILVKDINPGITSTYSINFFTSINSHVLFSASTPASGTELWVTEGNESTTKILIEINTGVTSSQITGSVMYRGDFYFSLGTPFAQLWKTDGTTGNTQLVKALSTNNAYSSPNCFFVANDLIFFGGFDNTNSSQLWTSDGTSANTTMLRRINTSGGSSACPKASIGPLVIFSGMDSSYRNQLWATDGTSAGTINLKPGVNYMPQVLATLPGLFIYSVSDAQGFELYVTDGTTTGTKLLKDINPGMAPSNVAGLGIINNKFIFTADDGVNGNEIWATDGTTAGTNLLKDISPGIDSSTISMALISNRLYFTVTTELGTELWSTDGTTVGTSIFKDINPGEESSFPGNFIKLTNGNFFFTAFNVDSGFANLYFSDKTNLGTFAIENSSIPTMDNYVKILDLNGNTFIHDSLNKLSYYDDANKTLQTLETKIQSANSWNQSLYFQKRVGSLDEFWKLDQDLVSTKLNDTFSQNIFDIDYSFTEADNQFYFYAQTAAFGHELWKSDGSAEGTNLVIDKVPGPGSSGMHLNTQTYNPNQGLLYFGGRDDDSVWITDGTLAGSIDISSAFTMPSYSYIHFYPLNNLTLVAFEDPFANSFNGRTELWSTDGSISGTSKLSPVINFSATRTWNFPGLIFNNKYYFYGTDGINGIEMWSTDGTSVGTTMLKDITAGVTGPIVPYAFIINNKLIFQPSTTSGIWVTDGTPGGTTLLYNGTLASNSILYKNNLYFAMATSLGTELWKTDGTSIGTVIVKDINPGTGNSLVNNQFIIFNDKLYFGANDGIHGNELFESDGTNLGTLLKKDINPGQLDSLPSSFKIINNKLYIIASTLLQGREIWIYDPAP